MAVEVGKISETLLMQKHEIAKALMKLFARLGFKSTGAQELTENVNHFIELSIEFLTSKNQNGVIIGDLDLKIDIANLDKLINRSGNDPGNYS